MRPECPALNPALDSAKGTHNAARVQLQQRHVCVGGHSGGHVQRSTATTAASS